MMVQDFEMGLGLLYPDTIVHYAEMFVVMIRSVHVHVLIVFRIFVSLDEEDDFH